MKKPKLFLLRLPAPLHRAAKVKAVREGRTLSDVLRSALADYTRRARGSQAA